MLMIRFVNGRWSWHIWWCQWQWQWALKASSAVSHLLFYPGWFSLLFCIYFLQLLLSLHHLSPCLSFSGHHLSHGHDWIQTPLWLGSGSFRVTLDRPWTRCATLRAQRRISTPLHEWPNVSVICNGKCCLWSCRLGQKQKKWRQCGSLIQVLTMFAITLVKSTSSHLHLSFVSV